MPIVFGYTPATNRVELTGGTVGVPATFADFVTADRAGTYIIMDAIAPAMNLVLDRPIRPVELRALKITFNLVGTAAGAGDTVDITGTDAWGNAQTESINVAAGNGAYTSAKYWRTITDIDCTGFAGGGGTIDAVQPQWGVIWDLGDGQYQIDAYLDIGDGVIATYLYTGNELILFSEPFYMNSKVNSEFQIGKKRGSDRGTYGSTIFFHNDSSNLGNNQPDFEGAVYWYGAFLSTTGNVIPNNMLRLYIRHADSEILYTHISRFRGLRAYGNFLVRHVILSEVMWGWFFLAAPDMDDVRISDGDYCGILLHTGPSATIRNVVSQGNTTRDLSMMTIQNDHYVIDSTYSTKTGPSGGAESVYNQKSCNIHVVDKDGVDINAATVACEDQFGTPVFSVNTAADGTIAEQIISYQRYYAVNQTQTYSPHKFTISKAGYETIELDDITVDAPIVWHLELLPALAETDVRDGIGFGEDKTGSLDLPSVNDVEKGVQFDNLTKTGTFKSPAEADVRDGEGYGANDVEFTGALDLPSINDVEDGVFFDGATKEGNFEAPAEEDVEVGVGYGSLGTEFTGTYLGLRGENLTAFLSESVSLVGQLAQKTDLTGELAP